MSRASRPVITRSGNVLKLRMTHLGFCTVSTHHTGLLFYKLFCCNYVCSEDMFIDCKYCLQTLFRIGVNFFLKWSLTCNNFFLQIRSSLPPSNNNIGTGTAVACYLTIEGANLNQRNTQGKTPLFLAAALEMDSLLQQCADLRQ